MSIGTKHKLQTNFKLLFMKNILSLCLLILFSNTFFAQEDNVSIRKHRVNGINASDYPGSFEYEKKQYDAVKKDLKANALSKEQKKLVDSIVTLINKEQKTKDSISDKEEKAKAEFQKEYEKKAYERNKKKRADLKIIKVFWISILSIILIVLAYFLTQKTIAKIKSTRKKSDVNPIKNSINRALMKLNTYYVNLKNSKYFKNLKTSEIIVMSVIFGVLCSYLLSYLFDEFYIVPPSFLICGGICFLYLSKKDSLQ